MAAIFELLDQRPHGERTWRGRASGRRVGGGQWRSSRAWVNVAARLIDCRAGRALIGRAQSGDGRRGCAADAELGVRLRSPRCEPGDGFEIAPWRRTPRSRRPTSGRAAFRSRCWPFVNMFRILSRSILRRHHRGHHHRLSRWPSLAVLSSHATSASRAGRRCAPSRPRSRRPFPGRGQRPPHGGTHSDHRPAIEPRPAIMSGPNAWTSAHRSLAGKTRWCEQSSEPCGPRLHKRSGAAGGANRHRADGIRSNPARQLAAMGRPILGREAKHAFEGRSK